MALHIDAILGGAEESGNPQVVLRTGAIYPIAPWSRSKSRADLRAYQDVARDQMAPVRGMPVQRPRMVQAQIPGGAASRPGASAAVSQAMPRMTVAEREAMAPLLSLLTALAPGNVVPGNGGGVQPTGSGGQPMTMMTVDPSRLTSGGQQMTMMTVDQNALQTKATAPTKSSGSTFTSTANLLLRR